MVDGYEYVARQGQLSPIYYEYVARQGQLSAIYYCRFVILVKATHTAIFVESQT